MEYLDENNVPFEIIDFIANPLTEMELRTVLKKLQKSAFEICRKNEQLYKQKYADKNLSEDEWIQILLENPSLIERPILIKEEVALIGRPLENVKFFME